MKFLKLNQSFSSLKVWQAIVFMAIGLLVVSFAIGYVQKKSKDVAAKMKGKDVAVLPEKDPTNQTDPATGQQKIAWKAG